MDKISNATKNNETSKVSMINETGKPSEVSLTWKDFQVKMSKELLTVEFPKVKESPELVRNNVYTFSKLLLSSLCEKLSELPEAILGLPAIPAVIEGMLINPLVNSLDVTAESLAEFMESSAKALKVDLNRSALPASSTRTINRWLRTCHGEILENVKTVPITETLESVRDSIVENVFKFLQMDIETLEALADSSEGSKGTREPLPVWLEELVNKTVEDFFIGLASHGELSKETSIAESRACAQLVQDITRRRFEVLPKLRNVEPRPGGNPAKPEEPKA